MVLDAESQTRYHKVSPYDAHDLNDLHESESSDDDLAISSESTVTSSNQPSTFTYRRLPWLWIFAYLAIFLLYISSWVAIMDIVWHDLKSTRLMT